MSGTKLFRTLVLGGIAAAGCGTGGSARIGGHGGAAVDATAGGTGGGELGDGSGPTGGAGGDMVDRGGAGGANGATGTGGTVTAGTGGEADASTIPDATVDAVACCPPECEGHACACLGGACCWLMVPGTNPACAKACFPHG